MARAKQPPATQEEKDELLASLLETITRFIKEGALKEWIAKADIVVEESYNPALKQTFKWMSPSWKEPPRTLKGKKFLWNNGKLNAAFAIDAFTKMLQLYQRELDDEWSI
jgi:hypothetical protein